MAFKAIQTIGQVLLKILHLIDPRTRSLVRMRKAVEWAEKFIHDYDELEPYIQFREGTAENRKAVAHLRKMMKYYRKWFFDTNN